MGPIPHNPIHAMNSCPLRILALAALAALSTSALPAVTLVAFDFENTSNLLAPDAANIAQGVSVQSITLNNLGSGSYNYTSPANRALALAPNAAQTSYSVSTVLANATYLSVKISVEEGYTLSLDSFSLQAASGGAAGTHRAFYVFSSLTGFSTGASAYSNVLLFDRRDVTGFPGTLPIRSAGLKDYSVTLTDPAFRNIASGTEVEFRIYIQTDGADRSIDIGNISLAGTLTAIPEPAASASLLSLGVLTTCLAVRRPGVRRRHG